MESKNLDYVIVSHLWFFRVARIRHSQSLRKCWRFSKRNLVFFGLICSRVDYFYVFHQHHRIQPDDSFNKEEMMALRISKALQSKMATIARSNITRALSTSGVTKVSTETPSVMDAIIQLTLIKFATWHWYWTCQHRCCVRGCPLRDLDWAAVWGGINEWLWSRPSYWKWCWHCSPKESRWGTHAPALLGRGWDFPKISFGLRHYLDQSYGWYGCVRPWSYCWRYSWMGSYFIQKWVIAINWNQPDKVLKTEKNRPMIHLMVKILLLHK